MMSVLLSLLQTVRTAARSRAALQLEVLALRHQLQVLQRTRLRPARLAKTDRWLWVVLSRLWTGWRTVARLLASDLAQRGLFTPRGRVRRRIMAERRRARQRREVQRIRTDAKNQIAARADDHLRAFVRVLARQAAREVFEAEVKSHSETIQ